jgi:hypothetical protein
MAAREPSTILDTTRHSYDMAAILTWMLEIWDVTPSWDLLILTHKGDGSALDNRLRVKLSTIRKELKQKETRGMKQFGFESRVIGWTLEDGTEREALVVQYRKTMRHSMRESFDEVFGDLKDGK